MIKLLAFVPFLIRWSKPKQQAPRKRSAPLPPARKVQELRALLPDMTAEDYRQKDHSQAVNLLDPERKLTKPVDRLSDAKAALRAMTYDEFMEHCRGMGGDPKKVWAYATDTVEAVPALRMAS